MPCRVASHVHWREGDKNERGERKKRMKEGMSKQVNKFHIVKLWLYLNYIWFLFSPFFLVLVSEYSITEHDFIDSPSHCLVTHMWSIRPFCFNQGDHVSSQSAKWLLSCELCQLSPGSSCLPGDSGGTWDPPAALPISSPPSPHPPTFLVLSDHIHYFNID